MTMIVLMCHNAKINDNQYPDILSALERLSFLEINHLKLEADLDESLSILAQGGPSVHLNGKEGNTIQQKILTLGTIFEADLDESSFISVQGGTSVHLNGEGGNTIQQKLLRLRNIASLRPILQQE